MRITYPFDIDFMESGALDAVAWIRDGHPLYAAPRLEFIPFAYGPLHVWVSAALASVTGVDFAPLRALSVFASLGCAALIGWMVWRDGKSLCAAIVGGGLFLACFELTGTKFDLVRIDSLFLLLLLAGLALLQIRGSGLAWMLAGAFITVSFFTKQTALPICLPLVAYALIVDFKRGILFLATSLGGIIGGIMLMDRMTAGWFSHYVLDLPRARVGDGLIPSQLVAFWTTDMLQPLAIAFSLALLHLLARWERRDWDRLMLHAFAGAGMIGASWVAKLEGGSYGNNLYPAAAWVALGFGLGVATVIERLRESEGRAHFEAAVWLACAVQLAALLHDPREHLPTSADREAAQQLLARIENIDGDVLMLQHGHLPRLAGKRPHAHFVGLIDVLRAGRKDDKERLIEEVETALREQRFGAVIVNSDFARGGAATEPRAPGAPYSAEQMLRAIEVSYTREGHVFDRPDVAWMRSGPVTRPEWLYAPSE
jgi:hypothetical protein